MFYSRFGSALVWIGIVLVLASAVPIHYGIYVLLVVAAVVRQRMANQGGAARRHAALLLAVSLALDAEVAARGSVRLGLPPSHAVAVLGDSLSAGVGSSAEGTWPQILSARLGVTVSNLARAGATLADGLDQVRAVPPTTNLILVELGGNDMIAGTSTAEFAKDLRALLTAVSAGQRRVLMFELPLLPLQNAFGRIQRQVCAEHGVTLLPRSLLAGAIALPGHATDGLHLSTSGHAWLAGRVCEAWSDTHAGSRRTRPGTS